MQPCSHPHIASVAQHRRRSLADGGGASLSWQRRASDEQTVNRLSVFGHPVSSRSCNNVSAEANLIFSPSAPRKHQLYRYRRLNCLSQIRCALAKRGQRDLQMLVADASWNGEDDPKSCSLTSFCVLSHPWHNGPRAVLCDMLLRRAQIGLRKVRTATATATPISHDTDRTTKNQRRTATNSALHRSHATSAAAEFFFSSTTQRKYYPQHGPNQDELAAASSSCGFSTADTACWLTGTSMIRESAHRRCPY